MTTDADELLAQKIELSPVAGHANLFGDLTQTSLRVTRRRIVHAYAAQKPLKEFTADKTQNVISCNQYLKWQRTRLIRSKSVLKSHPMSICIGLEHV